MIAVKILRTWFFLLPFAGVDFNYDNPNKWIIKNPQCAGSRQSPIALYYTKPTVIKKLPPLLFQNYDKALSSPLNIVNNGHTVEVGIKVTNDGVRPSVTGGGVEEVYEAQSFHFHWGSRNKRGSEHVISGLRYDLEMHIVHKNTKFSTISEAAEDPFGLVVLGVLFKGVQSKPVKTSSLNYVYDILPNLSKYNSSVSVNETIALKSILGTLKTKNFFTYRGSLTTPPCSEAVTWFVFSDIVEIRNEDLRKFWTLYDSRGVPLLNNFRPIQPRGIRKVIYHKGP